MSAVARAVDAVAEVVRALPRAADDDDDDERAPEAEVVKISLAGATLGRIARRFPLTPVYREFLAAHSSHDFVDAGLRCGARAAWISAATSVEELTDLHREARGWGPHWLVCALAADGCYVLELDVVRDGDCPVLFVPAEEWGKVELVAPGFVAFLMKVARDSRPGSPVPEDRRMPGRAAVPAARADRGSLIVPAILAALAALLLWRVL